MPTQKPNQNVYDDEGQTQSLTGGGSTSSKGAAGDSNDPQSGSDSPSSLESQEGKLGSGASTSLDKGEHSFMNRLRGAEERGKASRMNGGFFTGNEAGSRLGSLKGRFGKFTRKKIAAGAVTAVVAMVGAFGFTIFQSTGEFLQFAKLLEKFHLRSTQDFGDSRTSRVLLYTLAGIGERGKLGVTMNVAADRWEKRIVQDMGIRPVFYDNAGRHHAGWEIVDLNKAEQSGILRQLERGTPDAERVRAGELDGRLGVRGKAGARLDPNTRLLYFDPNKVSARDKRQGLKTVSQASGYSKIISAMGFRLEKKRLSIHLHPLNGVKQKRDIRGDAKARKKADEDFKKEQQERRAQEVRNGVHAAPGIRPGTTKDTEGNDVTDPADQESSDGSKKLIDDMKIKGSLSTALTSAAAIGVFCAAKGFGDNVDDYKYQNNAMPMMRMGANVISMGSQIQTGEDVNLDELGAFKESFYDEETKTSWTQAESIRAEMGKEGGEPLPEEAQLKNINDKPQLFSAIDSIPGLGLACDAQEGFFGLPIIKQVSSVINEAGMAVANGVLSIAGTNSNDLLEGALKAVAGKSVDPLAKGAEFGGLANTGAFLAGNDHAISMGGGKLSDTDVAQLREEEKLYDDFERSNQSLAERYLDINNTGSLASSIAMHIPSSSAKLASFFQNPLQLFDGALTNFLPKAKAAVAPYDYGVERYGFSLAHQDNTLFEDPYEIARKVEPELQRLDEEYSECFGIAVTPEGKLDNREAVNTFKVSKIDKCDPNKNTDNLFNHYRFYLADTVAAKGLACFEGDEEACTELNGAPVGTTGDTSGSTSGEVASGSEKELAQRLLEYKEAGKYNCDNAMDCEDLKMMAAGQSIKGGVGCIADKLDKRVMQVIIYLIDNDYKIGTYALCRAHSYNNGAHPRGRGLDISSINGTSINSSASKQDALKVAQILFELDNEIKPSQIITGGVGATRSVDPDFVKYNRCGPGIEGQAAVACFGSSTMAGHTDHIHVGY